MEDLQQLLQNVLQDPAQMEQVAAAARALGLQPPEAPPQDRERTGTASAASPLPDPMAAAGLIGRLGELRGNEGQVFAALKGSVSPGGRGKLDRALRAAALSRLLGRYLRGKDGDANV